MLQEPLGKVSVDLDETLPGSTDGNWQGEIVRRCIHGDEQAFACIIDHYGNLLVRTAFLLLQDEEMAKDVVQDSLILAWKNIHQLRDPALLRAWLLKIVVNQSTSLKRQLARRAVFLREQFAQYQMHQTFVHADAQQGHLEEILDLTQVLDKLPLKQRTVLILYYYHKMTVPEIATTLGVGEETLRKRLQSALDKLRRALSITTGPDTNLDASSQALPSRVRLQRGGA